MIHDGAKIEFDMQGAWLRVSRSKNGLPAGLVLRRVRACAGS